MKEDVGSKYNVNIYAPEMDNEGNIDIWPEGFFDEWDNALAELFQEKSGKVRFLLSALLQGVTEWRAAHGDYIK